jgi:hypothetical protein
MDIKSTITILPADDPRRLRLGWTYKEYLDEEDHQRDLLETGGQEALDQYLYENNPQRQEETDLSDRYLGQGAHWVKPNQIGFGRVNILPELKGTPYNNGVLNMLVSYRPSSVRVLPHNGIYHLDSIIWRVTIVLDENKMISSIYQEAEVGIHGKGCYTKEV